MRILILIAVMLGLTGCFEEFSKEVSQHYGLPNLTIWAIRDGKVVDVGEETVEIIGTDQCDNGFGDVYPCWKFSLTPGDTQLVTLSNGIQELWTTEDAGKGRVYLVRPNGFKVIAK